MSSLKEIFPCVSHCVKLWRAPLDNISEARTYFSFINNSQSNRVIEILVGNLCMPRTGRIIISPDISIDIVAHASKRGLLAGSFGQVAINLTDYFTQNLDHIGELEISLLELSRHQSMNAFAGNKKGREMRP